jgi:hypothetical protein
MNWPAHLAAGVLLAAVLSASIKQYRSKAMFLKMVLWFSAANFIDIDHLLATPIFDPARCSLNFHPLHSWYMAPLYIIMTVYEKTRFFAIGVFLHLGLDGIDCLLH